MRRGRLTLGVLGLTLLANAHAQAPISWDELSEPLPTYGYVLTPGITPEHLALNIEGFTVSMLGAGEYGRMLRARGLTLKREETLARAARYNSSDREILLMYLAWLQDAVERAPKPGGLRKDGVDWDITEPSRKALGTRKPVASDFKLKRREVPENQRNADAELKPGTLEFGSGKP
ncbi:MAG: hypothetical protein PHS14_03380 [Elusimicrobia bacterium]|nr:hypothetical protein [Elusimicrobiota bacterium]